MERDIVKAPYSQQELWADVSPIFVDDGNSVVAVQYTPEHREALSYFRAVLVSGEKSTRVLELASDMIRLNMADYTAWQLRWLCVEALDNKLEEEYQFTEDIMKTNAKNYQLWNHRRKIALKAGPAAAELELEFSARALDLDEKNYHAWAHRMAVVEAFGLWEIELLYVEEMIDRDIRNNSAWNQRAFIMKSQLQLSAGIADEQTTVMASSPRILGIPPSGITADLTYVNTSSNMGRVLEDTLSRELTYVSNKIAAAPRNESCWNYLLGLFTLPGCSPFELCRWPQVYDTCMAAVTKAPSCPPALAALAEFYIAAAESAVEVCSQGNTGAFEVDAAKKTVRSAVRHAFYVLEGLDVADPIRAPYWAHRKQRVQMLLSRADLDVDYMQT
ncbi:hypothetical protein CEUSTIGMA_g1751.t1 [Chlamydomonas eustigma]|uniref:Protein farnesyltransferase/geranylgeranyltransferase type-1 subunit alpha n=1 Tax=Chlamydomonas eustigma TaxID=1157962 RepID=A0A250WUJ4_9CHLO|nr:hypothetical protein CEUSTIGMA_g1751.t1 [Chlamydomonas eustigma]|eukprot:GAX74302.1 hypothetical protein CEUSTIGMA_g1751.t1 [Chlamydomonas eustigma]